MDPVLLLPRQLHVVVIMVIQAQHAKLHLLEQILKGPILEVMLLGSLHKTSLFKMVKVAVLLN